MYRTGSLASLRLRTSTIQTSLIVYAQGEKLSSQGCSTAAAKAAAMHVHMKLQNRKPQIIFTIILLSTITKSKLSLATFVALIKPNNHRNFFLEY